MATKEEQESLRLLAQHTLRAFYEPKYTIVVDLLSRTKVMKDDDLAGRMGIQVKELNKLMARLSEDKLVSVYRQNELKEGAQRSVGRQYYYIDYKQFCNVVKWRVSEMRRRIDNTLRNEIENKGYICPQCHRSYLSLEVDKLLDIARGGFFCEDCHHEVVENEDAESVKGSQDRMSRFHRAMRFITEGLKKTDPMVLPPFDVAMWVKNNLADNDKQKAAQNGGLKIAGSGSGGMQDDAIGIVMSLDKDEATRKKERDEEAEAKRQQNSMPEWHRKSTISGHLTALGEAERARVEKSREGHSLPVSNDELLRGLGTATYSRPTPEIISPPVEESKQAINEEADYYDQYYASLAASSVATPQDTSSGKAGSEDVADFNDEEDRKPSVEYLDSLNDYRKRSRSREDVGEQKSKVAKLVEDYGDAEDADMGADAGGEGVNGAEPPADDPMVNVNGVPMPYSQITEAEQEQMTPDEYTAYYEVMMARESG